MDKTANYGLNKPAGSDYADVVILNENMDVIDLEMKKREDFAKEHAESKKNPHGVTKEQVGLGNVPNVATNDQTPTYTEASSLTALASGEKLSVAFGKIKKAITDLISHIGNKSNPHGVTVSQIGAAASGHTHDDRYFTESEMNSKLSAKQDASTAINTGNIGSQSVCYSAQAHELRTYAADGSDHGEAWKLNVQHNRAGDSTFRLYCGDGSVGTSVNRADSAGDTDTVDGWHVQLEPGTWGLKPFAAGTGDMVAGSTALATGHIYLVYE